VEELSIQNHDLIMKLKDSMQRELELRLVYLYESLLNSSFILKFHNSSKSAAIVSNNVGVAMLPSIENGHSGRAHSEPGSNSNMNGAVSVDDISRRHGGKKKKGL